MKHFLSFPALAIGLCSLPTDTLPAQTLRTIVSFSEAHGDFSNAPLILSGHTFYGTTFNGGPSGNGTIFALNIDGTGFTNLYSFAGPSDGRAPNCLVLASNILYGTAHYGGDSGSGTLFALNTDGTGFTELYSFSGHGAYLEGLASSGNMLYGNGNGGAYSSGGVFSFNTDGTGFLPLYSLTGGSSALTEDDASPLILSGDTLYGTTIGTVFKVNTDGSGFSTLHTFSPNCGYSCPNNDGAIPTGGLILSGNTLYGTAASGGRWNFGTVFAVNTNGTGFRTLHSFAGSPTDGAEPHAGLVFSGNTLYGTTRLGGPGAGTLFAVNTDGTGFTNLHYFPSTVTNSDGSIPYGGLVILGNTIYGTCNYGGTWGHGTLFSISLPLRLTLTPDGFGGFFIRTQGQPNFTCQLQRATTLNGPWSTSDAQAADSSGLVEFHDLFPPSAYAFYRTVQQQ